MMKKDQKVPENSNEPNEDTLIEQDQQVEASDIEPEEAPDTRGNWQRTKEGWYDKVHLTVRQLDIVIALGVVALIVVAIFIARDAGAFR